MTSSASSEIFLESTLFERVPPFEPLFSRQHRVPDQMGKVAIKKVFATDRLKPRLPVVIPPLDVATTHITNRSTQNLILYSKKKIPEPTGGEPTGFSRNKKNS